METFLLIFAGLVLAVLLWGHSGVTTEDALYSGTYALALVFCCIAVYNIGKSDLPYALIFAILGLITLASHYRMVKGYWH